MSTPKIGKKSDISTPLAPTIKHHVKPLKMTALKLDFSPEKLYEKQRYKAVKKIQSPKS